MVVRLAVDSIDDVSLVNNTFVGNSSTQGDDVWATLSPTEIINTILHNPVVRHLCMQLMVRLHRKM